MFDIDGIIPIIPTPFTPAEEIDWEALDGLIEFAIAGDAWGVCLPAYASEFYKLSEEERRQVVARAVVAAKGRVPVIAQANHPAARHAAALAVAGQKAGASAIAVAIPRQFAIPEAGILRYLATILESIEVPLIVQDFNPGGSSISAQFIADLHRRFPHFRYVKLEEPLLAAKIEAVREATNGEVGVIEGWGGMYILELIPAGSCGVMPSLGLVDLLARIYRLLKERRMAEAYEIFQGVLPQIVYSLYNMELYHHAEKRLLEDRGVLRTAAVRSAGWPLEVREANHVRFLNSRVLALLDRLGMPWNPAGKKASDRSAPAT